MIEIQNKIETLGREVSSISGQMNLLSKQIGEAELKLAVIEKKRVIYKKAVEVLDLVQQTIRKIIKDGFESVVANALQTIYGAGFKFNLEFGRRGNLQEAYFIVTNDTLSKPHDPKSVSAGGELDVIAFALRVVILELYQRTNKAPLICDEPFKSVSSSEYINASGRFLQTLNEKIERQVILVTHQYELEKYADNFIDIENLTKEIKNV